MAKYEGTPKIIWPQGADDTLLKRIMDGYEPPITGSLSNTSEIIREVHDLQENEIFALIRHKIGIDVDKPRLMAALAHDRTSYENGVRDGIAAASPVKAHWEPCLVPVPNPYYGAVTGQSWTPGGKCSHCQKKAVGTNLEYCPHCGAIMVEESK